MLKRHWRITLLSLITVATLNANGQSQPVVFESDATQTGLLELFTSEGCSSCPPAETWLSSLKESPGLWKEFVPVAFHVDYFNRPWRDPWSSREFSDLQRAYAAWWGRPSVYTPGFVFNGNEWPRWSGLGARLKAARPQAGVLKATSSDQSHWQVRFTPLAPSQPAYEAYAALLASGLTSDIRAGENQGRYLTHDFVVVTLVKNALRTDRGTAWGQVVLSKPAKGQAGRLALAVWVKTAGRMEPLQAVGGWLR